MVLARISQAACILLSSFSASAHSEIQTADVARATKRWMDAVVVRSDPEAVAGLFCDVGLLVATAGVGIRMQNSSEDGWGEPKRAGTTIKTYFDWFATLPEQNITRYMNNVENIDGDVWVDNAWVNWVWQGNPGLVARMTFVYRFTPEGDDVCIFELHSSQLPQTPDDSSRRLRGSAQHEGSDGPLLTAASVEHVTSLWMDAVVNQSAPKVIDDLFCDDGILVATAGVGLLRKKNSEDGWGAPKPADSTIKSYFEWFATLPEQNIVRSHNNVAKISDKVWVNNAWVDWVWSGNPGLTARMTFIVRETPAGACIFELHSSQLPEN